MKLLEALKEHFVGRLLPEMRKLILGWREEVGVTHISKTRLSEEVICKRMAKVKKARYANCEKWQRRITQV
jgi:hypothetical protein